MNVRKSRYDRRFKSPVPVRYLALGLGILILTVLIWPENNTESLKDKQSASYMPDVVTMSDTDKAEVESGDIALNTTGEQEGGIKDILNLKGDISFDSFAEKRQEKKLAKYLDSLSPAAGKPVEVGGVYLPEPRPQIFEQLNLSASDIQDRLDEIKDTSARHKTVTLKSGDTLADALVKSLDVTYQDAHDLTESIKSVFDPRDVKPGQSVTAHVSTGLDGNPLLMAVVIEKDIISSVVATRISKTRFSAAEVIKPTDVSLKAVQGTIDNSLYLSANAMDVPDAITVELIRIYSWAIDFQRDIRQGDKFEIFYEQHTTEDGMVVPNKGNIRYATMMLGDRPYSMYRYETLDGRVDFFEPNGRSIRKALMKTPIDGARLSSGFGKRRHPVLGYAKMHKGLDFAAPRGTPIYAAGDGVIERMGPFSSYGNYVRIRHREGLKTAYAHLKGFKRGLRAGSRVKQGDIIGYVGTTGRSTGPHLHYEVHLNNVKVNPRTIKLPTGEKLKGQDLIAFKEMVGEVNRDFASMGRGKTLAALESEKESAVKTN